MIAAQPEKWVENYADYLFSLSMLKINKREEAEDMVQEVFMAAYKNVDQFKGESTEKTWLTAILKNKIIDYYRRNKPEKSFTEYLHQTQTSFENHFFDNSNYGRWIQKITPNYISNNADLNILSADFKLAMDQCLGNLPLKIKQVFMAKYLDDTESKDICQQFEISDSNYWVIIFRAKTLLRTCLEKSEIL